MVGLFDKFETVTCGEDVVHGKPDPEMYLLACERAGFAPEECAVVEDSRNGCVSGITAGCHVFAVPDIVPLPQDVVDGCEAVRPGGGSQGRALDNCGVETSNCPRLSLRKRGPAMVGPLLLKRRHSILTGVL